MKMPIHPSAQVAPSARIYYPELVNIYGATIGEETRIGPFVEIQRGVIVGARCKIQSHVPGDEVLVPAHTFMATLWGVIYVVAAPVLCDVDETSATIDLEDAEPRVMPRTRAIIPVHLYGQSAEMGRVADFARRHNLLIVEDAAQSIGARWGGRSTGTLGSIGCFSFYPGKNLGAAGEAGLVVTHDAKIAARLHSLRNHGEVERYVHAEVGFNYPWTHYRGRCFATNFASSKSGRHIVVHWRSDFRARYLDCP
jgi:dTDP-4-amino-4,6-dideoxygalactose transaminase